jgi:septal ring factor EnvC (AmiA/AmiB activator)
MVLGALRRLMSKMNLREAGAPAPLPLMAAMKPRTLSAPGAVPPVAQSSAAEPTPASAGTESERLEQIREEIQREEGRLEGLRQERMRMDMRSPRLRGGADPALQEQESRLRLVSEKVSQAEARLKRIAIDEKSHQEKISTLKHQIAELRGELLNPKPKPKN